MPVPRSVLVAASAIALTAAVSVGVETQARQTAATPAAAPSTPTSPSTASQDEADRKYLADLPKYEGRREARQRVADIFAALELKPGAHVADIGAGSGFFTVRLAKAVGPTGRVVAVDINDRDLRRLSRRVREDGLTQVDVRQGTQEDARLDPQSLDAALIVNAYHEMERYPETLRQIRQALKPGAPLVLVEPTETLKRDGTTREQQVKRHTIGAGYAIEELRAAGFGITSLQDPFVRRGSIDEEWLVVAKPLGDATRAPQSEQTEQTSSAPAAPAARAETLTVQQRIYLEDFKPLFDSSDVLVIDTRDAESYREGHIPGAVLIPVEKIDSHLDRLRAERRKIVAYCSCPAEETSGAAVLALARHGITNARALVGGYRLWAARKLPVSTGDESCTGPTCPLKTTRSASR